MGSHLQPSALSITPGSPEETNPRRMKLYLYSLFFLCYIGWSSGATMIQFQPFKGKEPFCYDEIEGKKKHGEQWYDLKNCIEKICFASPERIMISYHSCGVAIAVGPNCRMVTPTEPKRYPDCCPQPVCH